jgi:hypothetical protein
MKKQRTIINANDIKAALAGEHVEPLNKVTPEYVKSIEDETAELWKSFYNDKKESTAKSEKLSLTPDKGKKEAKKTTRRTTRKATTKKNIAAEVCKQLCFCFEVKAEEIYFANVKTMKELKEAYKALAAIHHPDRGGDTVTMGKINAEYDQKVKELAKGEAPAKHTTTAADGMTDEEIAAAIAAEFKATLDALMKLDLEGVKVELIGSWLWVSGNTKPIKDELKALKFRWCPKKTGQPWTWHDSYTLYISSKGRMSKADIEDKYGVEELKSA